jgi:ubiquitin-protein ligase
MITLKERMVCERRTRKEYADLLSNPTPNVKIACDAGDHLNWFCLIHDLTNEEYLGGEYIINIKLSPRYPFEAPDFLMLTPSGRFAVSKKLCFSNSSHHQESWSPIWNMRTIILGFLSFFMENTSSGVGHIDTPKEEKIRMAGASQGYNAQHNAVVMALFAEGKSDA